jgi:ATP-dependent DNA ligase
VPGTPVSPMLAKPTKSVDEVLKRLSGQRLTVEYKYDGERMQLHRLADGTIRIFSRSSEDTTQRWPEIASASFWKDEIFTKPLSTGGGDGSFVLDAEVVAWDTEKKVLLPFQVLSTRKRKADETEEQKVRVIVQGFDLLFLHGKSLLRQPLITRRRNMYDAFQEVEGKFTFAKAKDVDLRDAADKKRDDAEEAAEKQKKDKAGGGSGDDSGDTSSSSDAMDEDAASSSSSSSSSGGAEDAGEAESAEDGEQMIASFMNEAVDGSCEGLMVKTLYGASATYEPSVRSLNWLKLKKDYMDGMEGVPDSLDLVPIGAYAGKGKRTGVWGAYLLAVYDGDSEEFQSVCKIGTGFSDVALKELSEQFEEHQYPEGCARPRMFQLGDTLEPDVYFKAVKVWEVRAADLSLSSTHKGGIGKPGIDAGRGIGLRFPRFIRAREDKPPENATSAQQIRDMYFDQQCVDSSNANAGTAAADDDDEYL